MKCPYCGKEMTLGRVTAGGYRIDWLPEERKCPLLSGLKVLASSW